MIIVVYGSEYWKSVVNFDVLVQKGTISPHDMKLFHFADTPAHAFSILKDSLTRKYLRTEKEPPVSEEPAGDVETEMSLRPEIAKTRR